MRDLFAEYYQPNDEQFREAWQSCLFVFDANVLLKLYRYSDSTKDDLLSVLSGLCKRIWLPHQAALEYQRKRAGVIASQIRRLDDAAKKVTGTREQLSIDGINLPVSAKGSEHIATLFDQIEDEIHVGRQYYVDLLSNDTIRAKLSELFQGRVGQPYGESRIAEICREGEPRYARQQPPGYKDKDKEGVRQYGDLILWFQILDKVAAEKRPIVFVTDDGKDDWWAKEKGFTVGPRVELVAELRTRAEVPLCLYDTPRFLHYAEIYLDRPVKPSTYEEMNDRAKQDEANAVGERLAELIAMEKEIAETATLTAVALATAAGEGSEPSANVRNAHPDDAISICERSQERCRRMWRDSEEALEPLRRAMRDSEEALEPLMRAMQDSEEALEPLRRAWNEQIRLASRLKIDPALIERIRWASNPALYDQIERIVRRAEQLYSGTGTSVHRSIPEDSGDSSEHLDQGDTPNNAVGDDDDAPHRGV